MGANGAIGAEVKAPIGPVGDRSIPLEDDSGTIPWAPRRAFIVALTRAVDDPAVGDLALAAIAARLLLHLVDLVEANVGQRSVDLASDHEGHDG